MFESSVSFIRNLFPKEDFIPLHTPQFDEKEKELLCECIDSTFVSSVGKFVGLFEQKVANFTGAKHAIALVNGTQALFLALKLANVRRETEVITQSLTFIATANTISYAGATPIFLDVDRDTFGLSPKALSDFLEKNTIQKNGCCWNRITEKQITACIPMHTFGHPCRIEEIKQLCENHNIFLVEDSAESLGSYYRQKHTGRFGKLGIFSFNGNKIITTGGGGMIITDDEDLAQKAKHLSTTAKENHPWEFIHNEIGFNYRMPNINAALGVAQMEKLPNYIKSKRELTQLYKDFFASENIKFLKEPDNCHSNYWLNAVILKDKIERDHFLKVTNNHAIMTRCLWRPMHMLPMFRDCQTDALGNTEYLYNRVVNIPSSVREQ
jgi:perosamine synthetase